MLWTEQSGYFLANLSTSISEFDIHVEHHSKYVFNEKRIKFKQTYNEVMNLYKQEKREDKVKELEQKMLQYESERARKIQQYSELFDLIFFFKSILNSKKLDIQFHSHASLYITLLSMILDALRFSLEANPVEIPLPDGSSIPNAAMTPVTPVIPVQFLMPQARAGILKNSHITRDISDRTEPPGPPCGLPPLIGYEDDDDEIPSKRRVRFEEDISNNYLRDNIEAADDDFGPVESKVNTLIFLFLFFFFGARKEFSFV